MTQLQVIVHLFLLLNGAMLVVITGDQPPNFLIFFVDDMGYYDIEPFGRKNVSTPNFNRLANEGLKFTQWISAAPICTPSRAGLQTGRLAHRMGLTDNVRRVFATPSQPGGLPWDEITIGTALRAAGYATGMSGKWHLGVGNRTHHNAYLPTSHGYDTWLGHPMSNSGHCPENQSGFIPKEEQEAVCLLMANTSVVQQPLLLNTGNITAHLALHAIKFLSRVVLGSRKVNTDGVKTYQPFYFLMSFLHVHTALFSSPQFTNVSRGGKFGDNVEETDWAVGLLLDTLDRLGVAQDTLVLMTSDNGPYMEDGWDNAGRTGGLTGSKGQTWEGGIRVPGLARWPGHIPAGSQTDACVSTLDIFPTLVHLSGSQLPNDGRIIDGKDMTPILLDPANTPSQHEFMWHYCGLNVTAARHGNIKVHFATANWTTIYKPSPDCIQCCPDTVQRELLGVGLCNCDPDKLLHHDPPLMFDMHKDRNESTLLTPENFPDFHKEIVIIKKALAEHYATIGDPPNQLRKWPLIVPELQPCCNHEGEWPFANCTCNKLP